MLEQLRKANEVFKPMKIMIYGVQGIGKNTLAATFPNPVLVQTEDGSSTIDIMAFPQVFDFKTLMDQLNSLGEGEHDFKTIIVDSLDWLEPIIWAETCAQHEKPSIESFGYGKGYIEADKNWREVMTMLDNLRLFKGLNIVLLAHSEIKRFEAPDTDAYDLYKPAFHNRASAMWMEWADMVLFMNYKVQTKSTDKNPSGKKRGIGTGERSIFTTQRPAYYAKSRWPLPEEIFIGKDKDFTAFHDALTEATGGKYIRG